MTSHNKCCPPPELAAVRTALTDLCCDECASRTAIMYCVVCSDLGPAAAAANIRRCWNEIRPIWRRWRNAAARGDAKGQAAAVAEYHAMIAAAAEGVSDA